MAVDLDLQQPSGSGKRISYRPMSQINVTPFVDVMLVLLIVFMVTAPLLTVGVPVDLPQTEAAQLGDSDEPLVVTVDKEGRVYLQETEVPLEDLAVKLMAITENRRDVNIFVRGDRALLYGRVMEVMGALNVSGFTRVSLVAELPRPGG